MPTFFIILGKRTLEYVEMVDIYCGNKRLSILRNIKTWWIFMMLLAKIVLSMHWDVAIFQQVAHNLELLCDLEVTLGLSSLVMLSCICFQRVEWVDWVFAIFLMFCLWFFIYNKTLLNQSTLLVHWHGTQNGIHEWQI